MSSAKSSKMITNVVMLSVVVLTRDYNECQHAECLILSTDTPSVIECCFSECHCSEYLHPESHSAESRHTVCLYTDCRYFEWHYAEWHAKWHAE
jgi:hypothetical protein